MHARIVSIGTRLNAILSNPPAEPTTSDRRKLMEIRDEIKSLAENMTGEDEANRRKLYAQATREANRQEEFYENNGNRWADEAA